MTSSTRIRFGALAAAAAVVAGGLFAAAPANAATGTITVANTTFTAGDWGTGLAVSGTGFTAASTVTITVTDSVSGVLDSHAVATAVDATGNFTEAAYKPATPLPTLVAGQTITVSATSNQGDTSNSVTLTVNPALAPKGIKASATTVTTAELADPHTGVSIHAAGYTPGEKVTATVAYAGRTENVGPYTAAADGSVDFGFYLGAGVSVAGTIKVTVVGATSAVSQSIDISVTGNDVVIDGSNPGTDPVIDGTETAADSASTPAANLPVVSG